MARTSYQNPELTQSEIEEQKAKTRLTNAQVDALYRDLVLKEQGLGIEREKVGVSREEMRSREGIAEREIASKDRQTKLAAAMDVLGNMSKAAMAGRSDATQLLQDVVRRTDIPTSTLAETMAAAGYPELYNAQAIDRANKTETYAQQQVPAILKASQKGAEAREKLRAGMEATMPGAFDRAVALAFPATAGESRPIQPKLYQGPVTGGTPASGPLDYNKLAATLLGQSGVTEEEPARTATAGGGEAPRRAGPTYEQTSAALAANPSVYADPSVGALEGSTRRDLAGGLSELTTPSGGIIRFRTPQGERANATLARFITPRDETQVAQAPTPAAVQAVYGPPPAPAGITDLVKPPPLPVDESQPAAPTPAPVASGVYAPAYGPDQSAAGYLISQLPQNIRNWATGQVPPEVLEQQELERRRRVQDAIAQQYQQ